MQIVCMNITLSNHMNLALNLNANIHRARITGCFRWIDTGKGQSQGTFYPTTLMRKSSSVEYVLVFM